MVLRGYEEKESGKVDMELIESNTFYLGSH